jgi:SIR2-like domain
MGTSTEAVVTGTSPHIIGNIKELVPLLASIYQRGRLVPFVGAGMSYPSLPLWDKFLFNLEQDAEAARKEHGWPSETAGNGPPEVRAQRAETILRNLRGEPCFIGAVRRALLPGGQRAAVPEQTEALAALRWPLIVSTNYDDLLYGCLHEKASSGLKPILMGRSAADCKMVVSSLNSPFDRECVWHIQGFLGEQHGKSDNWLQELRARGRDTQFEQELVLGHGDYRRATTTAVHFRRCFCEVFRSRSFLFLGSSIEQYFLNLFGEILDLVGPSPVPHFAFVLKGTVDHRFLSDQMNTAVCEYEDDRELSHYLGLLKKEVDRPRTVHWCNVVSNPDDLQISALCAPPLASLAGKHALAVVSRHDAGGSPRFSDALNRDEVAALDAAFWGSAFEPDKHVLRAPCGNAYAVSAAALGLGGDTRQTDVRAAARALLDHVCEDGFEAFHMLLPAHGGNVPPVYGFMEAVRMFGCWKRSHPESKLQAYLYVGPEVALNLTSLRIDLQELLTSDLVRFWTEVMTDAKAEPFRRVFYHRPEKPLTDLLREVGAPASEAWELSVSPSPRTDDAPVCTAGLEEMTLEKLGVVFGSVVSIRRKLAGVCAYTAGAAG